MHSFEWDNDKNQENRRKHGVSFEQATQAFFDVDALIIIDERHSTKEEERYFCVGRVGKGIMTVRFTRRNGVIRIFGAGFWRKYRKKYNERGKK